MSYELLSFSLLPSAFASLGVAEGKDGPCRGVAKGEDGPCRGVAEGEDGPCRGVAKGEDGCLFLLTVSPYFFDTGYRHLETPHTVQQLPP